MKKLFALALLAGFTASFVGCAPEKPVTPEPAPAVEPAKVEEGTPMPMPTDPAPPAATTEGAPPAEAPAAPAPAAPEAPKTGE